MATETRSPLLFLADWIQTADPQADRHLPLFERARRVLGGGERMPPEERLALATTLEKWRYQHLDDRPGRLSLEDRRLVDALDSAASQLAGNTPRPPRAFYAAVLDSSCQSGALAEARAALDPAAPLEDIARRARQLTEEHFRVPGPSCAAGPARRRMLLYAPLYLSSYCTNHCVYCGFRRPHQIERRHLSVEEALHEAEVLRGRGFRHILLVAGDYPSLTTTEYYAEILRALVARGIAPGIEIAPQSVQGYAELVAAGACGITLYQETYNHALYRQYHPRGTKASYHWRLEGLERAAEAGIPRLGLGILLGLADPREDLLSMLRHAGYLRARFPNCRLAMSLPRIYDAPDGFQPPYPVDDETFVRLYCALRIAIPEAELVLSTREAAPLRNRLAPICITQMSAGSRTVPGGYEAAAAESSAESPCGQQFPVADHRTPAEVAASLRQAGIEPVWEIPSAGESC